VQTVFDAEARPTRTQQHMAKACDINNIMAKYQRTGAIDHFTKYSAQYGDVPAITFHEALEQVRHAQSMFDELPASLRDHFNHDPGAFLDFVQNDPDPAELEALGLVKRAEPTLTPAPDPNAARAPAPEGSE
jgi:phage internal scaffolding protein